jgi:hypothetical protein
MLRPTIAPLLLAAAVSASSPSSAADCDCSRRVGLCQAEARYDGARLSFTSQTEQCSRISFVIEDQAAAITIRQGSGSAPLTGARAPKDGYVAVEACYVCETSDTPR